MGRRSRYLGAADARDEAGVFGARTGAAVETYQRFVGIAAAEPGAVGPATKAAIAAATRNCDTRDDPDDEAGAATFNPAGQRIKYAVGALPGGSLRRPALLAELSDCFAQWSEATGGVLAFRLEDEDPDVRISFSDRSADNMFVFDGPGGSLAHATKKEIQFDASEKWVHADVHPRPRQFVFKAVALHEIGHCLGLPHTALRAPRQGGDGGDDDANDVMAPHYSARRRKLAPGDIARIKNLYPGK